MHMLVCLCVCLCVWGVSICVCVCVCVLCVTPTRALLWCGIKTGAPNENLSSETWHANKRREWTRELPQLEAPRTNDQAVRLSSWVARKEGREGGRGGVSTQAKVALNFMTFWGALKLNKFIGVRRIKNLPNCEGTKRSLKKAENIMCSSWIPHIEIKARLEWGREGASTC